jgi:hypothetical protein
MRSAAGQGNRQGEESGMADDEAGQPDACGAGRSPDLSGVTELELLPERPLADYRAAMALAETAAQNQLGEHMLLSWYDRDRDFESLQHASECRADSAIPGYVDYGLSHGATLKVDVEQGRFVFFYLGVDR